jgi:hypothetical protein
MKLAEIEVSDQMVILALTLGLPPSYISKTLNFPQLPWPLTTAYSKLQHLTAPYNIIGTRSDV